MSYIGVDLDGTLAYYDEDSTIDTIGEPIPEMLERVKGWLAAGDEVRIITARVAERYGDRTEQLVMIDRWCRKHLGQSVPIQSHKCGSMLALWDDRAVEVIRNTGIPALQAAEDTVTGKILTWLYGSQFDPTDANTLANVIRGIMTGAWK